jgi:hypothetical protein
MSVFFQHVSNHNFGSFPGKQPSFGGTHTPGATTDQRNFVFQPHPANPQSQITRIVPPE